MYLQALELAAHVQEWFQLEMLVPARPSPQKLLHVVLIAMQASIEKP